MTNMQPASAAAVAYNVYQLPFVIKVLKLCAQFVCVLYVVLRLAGHNFISTAS